jgi:putative spermidine/putrescine transport system substrate-binding protein
MRAFSKTLAAVLLCGVASLAQAAETAICYNCPPDWADWGTQLKAIAASTGVPLDNKNSGQSLAQLVAEQRRWPT